MNHMFLPILFLPFFTSDRPGEVSYVEYSPVKVYGARPVPEYVYLTRDYIPYTHGFFADDGTEDIWEQ